MAYRFWTDEQFINAVKTSVTKAEILKKLGYKSRNSGNYQSIDIHVKRLKLDTSHFNSEVFGPLHFKKFYLLEEILSENSSYRNTTSLKKKLLRANLLNEKCYICGILEWNGIELSLHLDHINGNRTDNRIENLRLLCPNCHSLTPTYCIGMKKVKIRRCIDCGSNVTKKSPRCSKCANLFRRNKKQKIDWPECDILIKMVCENGYTETGRILGISDSAIKKRIKTHSNIELPRFRKRRNSNEG